MGVWVTGDIHGDPCRLSSKNFPSEGFSREDIVVVCGDFGLVWKREQESATERYWLKWLEDKPFTTVFVDGNHENHTRLAEYPIKKWNGGRVHVVRPHVLHLMRGEVFEIEGRTFFAFGGASSHDVRDGILDYEDEDWRDKARALERDGRGLYRVKGLSWWEEELPSEEEMDNGIRNLERVGRKVDYIITHSPSTSEQVLLGGSGLLKADRLTDYLDDVKADTEYGRHIFGHMHINQTVGRDVCLYEQIIRLV